MIIKVNYTVSDIYMSTSVSPVYIKVVYSGTSAGSGVWGAITGTLSAQTDLQSALDLKVPTSRTLTINGVEFDLSANRAWTIDTLPSQTGNSGKYLTTNGTAASWATINLSGYVPYSGATGAVNLGAFGITANSFIKSGGTSAQFLKADGSVDSSTFVAGSGVANQLTYWNGTGSVTGSSNLVWDNTNTRLGIGNSTPTQPIDILFSNGTTSPTGMVFKNTSTTGRTSIQAFNNNNEGGSLGCYASNFTSAVFRNNFIVTATKSLFFLSDSELPSGGTSNIVFFTGGYNLAARMTLTAAGRLLLGTTTEGTFILDAVGSARVSGQTTINAATTGTSGYSLVVTDTNSNIGANIFLQYLTNTALLLRSGSTGARISSTNSKNFLGFNYSSGNVILGADENAASLNKLTIYCNSGVDGHGLTLFDEGGTGNQGAGLNFYWNGAGANGASIRTRVQAGYLNTILSFQTNNASNVLTERFRITETGNILVGSTTNIPSAILAADSTTKGFLPPRMTTTQINAIATPAEGLIAYNTTISHLCCYQGGQWVKFNHSPM